MQSEMQLACQGLGVRFLTAWLTKQMYKKKILVPYLKSY